MPTCQTGHLEIHYQDIGKKSAPVLLLLHGWGHSWETWAAYIPTLSEKYRLIIPDLPGFGQSNGSYSGWNMHDYSVWLETFLQRCEISEIHAVIGHSFGGKLLSFAWFAYGDSLSLPTVNNGFYALSSSGIVRPLAWNRRLLSALLQLLPTQFKRHLLQPLRRFLYTVLLKETDYLFATAFQENSLQKLLSEDITQHVTKPKDFPLHIAWGQNDNAVPLWMAYRLQTISENADVFVIPEADHFVHLTHPTSITTWLETWL